MKYIKLFENFKLSKDDIIEKIKSLEYILKDENLEVQRYGSRFDTTEKLTIGMRLGWKIPNGTTFQQLRNDPELTSTNMDDLNRKVEDIVTEDFFLEYIDRIEQLCQDENIFDSIDLIDLRINGNTFVSIDKNGQTKGVAYGGHKKEEIKAPNTYGDDDYANPV